MPSEKYHRAQADLATRLAAASVDPQIRDGYSRIAREQLAKANEAEPIAKLIQPDQTESSSHPADQ